MGTGADVAIEASDLTLVRGDLRVAVDAIRLARRCPIHPLDLVRGRVHDRERWDLGSGRVGCVGWVSEVAEMGAQDFPRPGLRPRSRRRC